MAEVVGLLIITAIEGALAVEIPAVAFTVGTASITSATVVGTASILGASIGLNYLLTPTVKQVRPADSLLSIRQPNPVRQGGYGRDRVAGAYMLYDSVDYLGKRYSFDVVALIGGRICGFNQIYLNDDAITFSGSGVFTISGFGGQTPGLADGRYALNVYIDSRVGLATETSYFDAHVALLSWAPEHRGDGIASIMMACSQPTTIEVYTAVFPSGLPAPSAVCDLYPIWDPRDSSQNPDSPATWIAAAAYSSGTTYAAGARITYNGAPYYSYVSGNIGHTPDTSTEWWCAVLQNPVLQLLDFLTDADHGMGLDRDILITPNLDALMASADKCDALLANAAGFIGARYTSNGKFSFDDDPANIIGPILATCDGWMTEDGDGALVLEVGVYTPPTVTLAAQHIVGFSINYGTADEQVVNELTLTYTSPPHGYKEVAGQPWRNESDISERGLRRSQSLALKWVNRHSQARHLTKIAMGRLSAAQGTITTTLYGLLALGKRWVRIQYPFLPGMADTVVELSKGSINFMAGTVSFEWIAVDVDEMYAWDPVTEQGTAPVDP